MTIADVMEQINAYAELADMLPSRIVLPLADEAGIRGELTAMDRFGGGPSSYSNLWINGVLIVFE